MVLLIITIISLLMLGLMARLVWGITYYGANTDNEKIIKAAAKIGEWGWLSGVHNFAGGKARIKEFAVLALAVMQRIVRDYKSDYSLVLLCFTANALSAIFVFLISNQLWGLKTGFFLFFLFLTSFWPAMIALWGGVVAIAQALFLCSVYLLLIANNNLLIYSLAGLVFGLLLFSSASSRKYIPLWLATLGFVIWGQPFRLLAVGIVFAAVLWVIIAFTFPNFITNLSGYRHYMQYGRAVWRSRFYTYREYFANLGKPIGDNFRGAGVPWLVKYFALMTPFIMGLFGISFFAALYLIVFVNFNAVNVLIGVVLFLLSLSPILIGEFSRGVQVGRAYFPGFLGFFLFIGYVISNYDHLLYKELSLIFWGGLSLVAFFHFFWNTQVFLADVLPARMTVANFLAFIKQRGINKLYSYETPFNGIFIDAIPPEIRIQLDIQYISSFTDVKEGYLALPGTNSRASVMTDYPLARSKSTKFSNDLALNQLIETKQIKAAALAQFKTLGTSRFWIHEDEVASYRSIILKETTAQDFWRGYAWLLDLKSLNALS